MSNILFLAIVLAITGLYLVISIIVSRRVSTGSDYFLAGKSLGIFRLTGTLIATQLGGGMLLGTAQEAYHHGLWGILYTAGMSFGFLILASGIASKLQSLNVRTTAELFTTRYGSPTLTMIASALSIATLCGLLIAQIVASKSVLASIGYGHPVLFALLWLLIIAYTMIGGLSAVVIMDSIQVVMVIVVFVGIFAYSVWNNPLSLSTLWTTSSSAPATYDVTGIILMPALFSLIEQDLAQKFFAAKDSRTATYAAFAAGICLLLFACIPVYFGMYAKNLSLALDPHVSPLLPMIKLLTNDIVVAMSLYAILAAIISTADSLLCAISSNISQDFASFWNRFGFGSALRRGQIITLVTGISAFIIAQQISSHIIHIMIGSYELSVVCLLIPLVASYYYSSVSYRAAYGAIIGGFFGFVFFRVFHTPVPHEVAALLCCASGYYLGSIMNQVRPSMHR